MKMTGQKQKRLPGWKALTAVFGARARLELAHLSAADFENAACALSSFLSIAGSPICAGFEG
jgi:hypothetical protein